MKEIKMGLAAVVYDDDTPETIMQKLVSARFLVDMRTDISEPLEDIVVKYNAQKKKQKKQESQNVEPEKPTRRFF